MLNARQISSILGMNEKAVEVEGVGNYGDPVAIADLGDRWLILRRDGEFIKNNRGPNKVPIYYGDDFDDAA